jgi:hypothetical protein
VSDPPRRTIVRVWYPARSGSGFRRARRLDRQQAAAAREFFDILGMGTYTFLADGLGHTMTNARQDAPAADGSFPLLLFSHGYYGDVSTNALLMETLASRGFVVASISHPGESSAMVYPGGTWFRLSPRGIEARRQTSGPGSDIRPDFEAIANGDVQARADYVTWYNSREITTERAPIWIDDFRAMLDAIEDGATGAKLGPAFSSADLTQVGFLGMSMGALTAPAACHQDRRCGAAAALDVGGGMPALRDARSRVPMLVFTADQPIRGGGQDFYYEPNATAGLDPRTHRFTLNGSTHWDFTDFALVLKPWMRRLGWIPGFGTSPGEALQAAQNRLIADFFDTYLKGENRGFPEAALAEHPLAIEDDLSAIRAWADGDL